MRLDTNGSAHIAVVGAGYVGLTTAICLTHLGHAVVCGGSDEAKVELLSLGVPTFVEDGLADLLKEGTASGHLQFVVSVAAAVRDAEFVFICVPTPERPDGSPDVSALESAATEIGPHLAPGAVVVNKSTVPIGSTVLVERLLNRDDIAVVSNPGFFTRGSAIENSSIRRALSSAPLRRSGGSRRPAARIRSGSARRARPPARARASRR